MKLKFFLPFLAVIAISSALSSCSKDDDETDKEKSDVVVSSSDALMLENFILDGSEPIITRASVEEDFPDDVKFLVYFQNNTLPLQTRKYDIGVALYDASNKRVCTYPLYEGFNLKTGKTFTMDDKIQLSKDLADGTYLLKPICKQSGEEEWVDFKLADALALTITISGTQAQIKEAFRDFIQVKNMSLDKTVTDIGEEFKVTLSLFTNNPKSAVPIYLAKKKSDGSYYKLNGELWTPNASGDGTVTLSSYSSEIGKETFYVLSQLNDRPISQFEITGRGQLFDFIVNNVVEIEDPTIWGTFLDSNSIKGTFIVQNFNEEVLSQEMYIMLGTTDYATETLNFDSLFVNSNEYKLISLSTDAFGVQTFDFTFSNLKYNTDYALTYGIKDEDGKFIDMSGDNMFFLYSTPSDPSVPSAEEDGASKKYDDFELYAKTRLDICPAIRFVNGKKVFVIQK